MTSASQVHRREIDGPTLDAAARGVGLSPVLQPIVTLPDGAVVGFEALARWPSQGNPNPLDVFAHASVTGQLEELDLRCVHAAIETASASQLPAGTLLAINCEPQSTYVGCADDEVLERGRDQLSLMFELTERSLLNRPRALLAKVAALRHDGFSIALDDVGAHPDSLALLDVLSPDVIKLDLPLVQSQPRREQARTLAAVLAHRERAGGVILAEGIENDDHLEQALALGADLGQGYKYCQPGPVTQVPGWTLPAKMTAPQLVSGSLLDLVSKDAPVRTTRKKTLLALSEHIEDQASDTADPPMILATLQHARRFTGAVRQRYLELARFSPLVAVFGQHLPATLGSGIRGVGLTRDDPLCREWVVLALGAQIAVALIARERWEQRPSEDARRFDFTITYNRALVTAAAHNLLSRML
jgi:EAL domain-containing protein (putative c-di-GMP-specific phosphodiesterase class I)